MAHSYSSVLFGPDRSFNVRALTIPEIADIIRRFRDVIGPMVGRATNVAVERSQASGSDESVKQAILCASSMLDQIVVIASDQVIDVKTVTDLPLPSKIEALGVIVRRTLEEIPIDRLTTSIALAAISTIGREPSSQWVQPAGSHSGLN